MTQYYIYQTEAEGVYSVSPDNRGTALAQFESSEDNRAAVLQAADQCMALTGQLKSEIQLAYIFDI